MVRRTSTKSLAARKKPVESAIKKKARRFRPGTVALRQIRHYQKDAGTLIPRLSFQRLVREAIQQSPKPDCRIQRSALEILQEAAEQHIVEIMEDAYAIECGVVKRPTMKEYSFRHAARNAQKFADKCRSLGVGGGSCEGGNINSSNVRLSKAAVHGSSRSAASQDAEEGAKKAKAEKKAAEEEDEEEEASASEEEEEEVVEE